MRHNIIKTTLALVMALLVTPMVAQDFLNIYFHDGTFRIFHFDNVKELCVTRYDAEGIGHDDYQYQHVITLNEEFVYDLADIDSISFTKYNDQVVEENVQSAMQTVLPALSQCETAGEVAKYLDQIKESEGVETAWIENGVLYVKIEGWQNLKFYFNNYVNVDEVAEANLSRKLMERLSGMRRINNADGKQLKAVVANQQHSDEHSFRDIQRNNYMLPLTNKLNEAGYDAVYSASADLDFFSNGMYDYDVVFLSTHGGYSEKDGHSLLTSEYLGEIDQNASDSKKNAFGKEMISKYDELFLNPNFKFSADDLDLSIATEGRIVDGEEIQYYVAYVGIKESFFKNAVTKKFKNPNSIFFNAACMSVMNNYSLADILRNERNLGSYLGYSQSNYYGQMAGCTMLMDMLDGISAEKAYYNLESNKIYVQNEVQLITGTYKDEVIKEYDKKGNLTSDYTASLILLPANSNQIDKRFITPVFTLPRTHEEVMKDYAENGKVTIKAITTTLNPSRLSMGFRYGINSNDLTEQINAESQFEVTDTGYGNYCMESTLDNLQMGKTYYYQAFTHDGWFFNYGDVVSFSIDHPALQLHTNSVSMEANTTTDVVIQQGSGNYTVKSSNSDVAEATVDIDHVHILAYAAGEATITVTDVLSGKTADILVTVTKPKETPANAIDLGLPSGTLWASYNVGATKPEEYGGYFAWGETDTKDYYGWDNYIHCDGTKDTCHDLGADIAGTDYDVAHVHWGEKWTTPTKAQINELTKQCTKEWTTQNGVKGCKITGPNGNSIFLPAVGFSVYSYLPYQGGESGLYMSSTECDSSENWCLNTDEKTFTWNGIWKFYGYAVRPVISPEPEYVENADQPLDLGLTSGTLWAQCNLGASQPHEPGNYYAWGETKPKDKYTKANYALYDSNTDTYTDIGTDISGTQYDAATATLGSSWHMPTYAEFTELKNECEWKYAVMNGVNGYRVTGPNGKSIFLPCADNQEDESTYPAAPSDTDGFYWSSRQMQAGYTISLHFDENGAYWPHGYLSFMGFSIRPVKSK